MYSIYDDNISLIKHISDVHSKKREHFSVFNNAHIGGLNRWCGATARAATVVIQCVTNTILAVKRDRCSVGQTAVLGKHGAYQRSDQPLMWYMNIFNIFLAGWFKIQTFQTFFPGAHLKHFNKFPHFSGHIDRRGVVLYSENKNHISGCNRGCDKKKQKKITNPVA